MFMKSEEKITLMENFVEALVVEKHLMFIGALKHDAHDDLKVADKKSQASSSKSHDKNYFDYEDLAKSLKHLTNNVYYLKRKKSESSFASKPYKPFFKKSSNPPMELAQSSNVVFNVEQLGMDNYYTFHQASY